MKLITVNVQTLLSILAIIASQIIFLLILSVIVNL